MAASNPDVSNGTCYYTNGEQAPSRFIPCGNQGLGHKPCCESLDVCLSSNACYNGQYGVTYLAGCTDPDFEDSSCPDKGAFSDQTWAGLVYCNGTSNQWVACEDGGSTVSSPSPCWCPSTSRTVAFSDASVLNNVMSLPASLSMSVTWIDVSAYASQHSLTAGSSAASKPSSNGLITVLPPVLASATGLVTAASTQGSANSTSSTSVATPSVTVSASNAMLGTGQKIGIALGSAGGVALFLLLALLVAKWLRRRREKEPPPPPMVDMTRPPSARVPTDPDMRSPAWSGHKSELAADESTVKSPAPVYDGFRRPPSAEVEGSPVQLSSVRPTHDGGYTLPGHKGTYYEMAG